MGQLKCQSEQIIGVLEPTGTSYKLFHSPCFLIHIQRVLFTAQTIIEFSKKFTLNPQILLGNLLNQNIYSNVSKRKTLQIKSNSVVARYSKSNLFLSSAAVGYVPIYIWSLVHLQIYCLLIFNNFTNTLLRWFVLEHSVYKTKQLKSLLTLLLKLVIHNIFVDRSGLSGLGY